MRKLNTTLDREPMTSQEIRDRQDFNYILKETAVAKVPIWKSIWFYGPVGIAMVTMVVSAVRINPQNEQFEDKTTLSQFNTTNTEDYPANTIVVEKSEELTETKSDSNKENETAIASTEQTVDPSNTVTPNVKADPQQVDPAFLANEKSNEQPEVMPEPPIERVVKIASAKTMPSIAGVFNGRVAIGSICSTGKIDCNNGYEIISFDIQYDNGIESTVDRVSGSQIPSTICRKLRRFNVGSPVFITRIVAMNQKGERKQLLSMQIEPTF
ncbi:MAG: hypothetical protein P8P74_14305 [Crocinitomicaceae bacterium]|nr:hypothetical protein [Crocinitomicaceae bacterium]